MLVLSMVVFFCLIRREELEDTGRMRMEAGTLIPGFEAYVEREFDQETIHSSESGDMRAQGIRLPAEAKGRSPLAYYYPQRAEATPDTSQICTQAPGLLLPRSGEEEQHLYRLLWRLKQTRL
jgi:hypothetical protein